MNEESPLDKNEKAPLGVGVFRNGGLLFSEADIKLFEQRTADRKAGNSKLYTWEEAKSIITAKRAKDVENKRREMIEDAHDVLIVESSKEDESVSWDEAKKELKKVGKL